MDYPPKLRPKKGWTHQTEDAPLPIPIQSLTNKPASNSRWFYYTAKLIEGSVLVQKKGDQHFLYRMGFFGKGNLSRGKPEHEHFVSSFQGHQRKSLPATERRFQQKRFQKVRQHRYERHLSWSKLKVIKMSKQKQLEPGNESHLKLEDTPSTSKDWSYDETSHHNDTAVTTPSSDVLEETGNVKIDDSSSDLEEKSQTTPVKKEWTVDASQWDLPTANSNQIPAFDEQKLNKSCKEESSVDYTCTSGLKKDGDWDSHLPSPIKRNLSDLGLRYEPRKKVKTVEQEIMGKESDSLKDDIEEELAIKEPDKIKEDVDAETTAREPDALKENVETEMMKGPHIPQENEEAEMVAKEEDALTESIEAEKETKEPCEEVKRATESIEERTLDEHLDHSTQFTVEVQDEVKDGNDNKGNKQKASVIRKPDPYPVQEFLQLSYEETFFLSYGLGCLSLCKPSKTSEEEMPMNLVDIWKEFLLLKPQFVATYACYHYYRSKGWVPRCGIKYGCDFVIYKKGPSFYHSTFAVLAHLVSDRSDMTPALSSWYSLTAFSRVIENAAKDVILCYVTYPDEFTHVHLQSPACIPYLKVHEVCMKRWRPTRERESRDYQSLIS